MSRLFNVSTTYRSAKLFITSAAARYLVVSSGLNYNLDGSIVHDHGDHYQRLIDMRPHLSTQCFLTDENCFQTTAAVSTEFATSKAHADWNEEKITKMALGRTKPKKKNSRHPAHSRPLTAKFIRITQPHTEQLSNGTQPRLGAHRQCPRENVSGKRR